MPRGSFERPQKQKGWRRRKRHGEPNPGPFKFLCPVAGDKAAYRSYPAAERELLRIQAAPDVPGEKKPCRVYECDDDGGCGFFHLTSLPGHASEAGEGESVAR